MRPTGPPPVPIRRRRRVSGADPLKKLSVRMHQSVAAAIRVLVEAGEAPSGDAFIEAAVVAHFRERRRQRVYMAYAAAAADPVFVDEMAEVDRAFDPTLGDGFERDEG